MSVRRWRRKSAARKPQRRLAPEAGSHQAGVRETKPEQSSAVGRDPLDGTGLRALLNAGAGWLDIHHEIVNALNVFPVPDGDTGTNMLLTMRSACREITEEHISAVGEVARAAAHGALMGARGNSGVILSQILRGFAHSLDTENVLTGPLFAVALSEGSRVAYRGVNRPVEGTILTVVREAAWAAQNAAEVDPALRFVLEKTVHAADEAVANTPNLLPVLAQTGKVDSGGKGLFFILEGMYRALVGEAVEQEVVAAVPAVKPPRADKGARELPPLAHGFDVQFLVEGSGFDVQAIRNTVDAMGECALVEGNDRIVKVHVHVMNPGIPLNFAVSLGFVTDVVVENMDDMHVQEVRAVHATAPRRFEERAPAVTQIAAAGPTPDEEPAEVEGPALISVVPGAGLAHVFRSLGAHYTVSGGQTMNPSTLDLLEVIRRAGSSEVILLPNNPNIIMAANQARILAGEEKRVAVIPSKSIPQGISALLAFNPHHEWQRNLEAMTSALDTVETGEVTAAVQDARYNGIEVVAGDIIGLHNDVLTARGETPGEVVRTLLEQMGAREMEVITLYFGQPVEEETARALGEELAQLYPDHEIEVVNGGQPYYHYIISAE